MEMYPNQHAYINRYMHGTPPLVMMSRKETPLFNENSFLDSPFKETPFQESPFVIRRTPRIIVATISTPLSTPLARTNKVKETPKPSYWERFKGAIGALLGGSTFKRILLISLIALFSAIIGYQIRKSEERDNYVRLPSTH
ncbi:hypothetical protein TCON_1549 [Astathelohania contejeani]|uniref:Uncharacterized protein n=1 Tax=Astathelohania contejeani TaxID=164912 RepID=A0ABQ7HYK2_9MICR|nr:hypothetical protein TCON_1549 [Thelohania contejeani]